MDIHYFTLNIGSQTIRKNRFTGKMQSVSVPDTLTKSERNAVLRLLRGVNAPAPDEFDDYIVDLPDGGSAQVRPLEDDETQLWVGLLVTLRVFTPGLAKLFWELCRDGNMAAVPVLKDQEGMVLVASEIQRERALARWTAPLVMDSPDQFFQMLSRCTEVQQTTTNQVGETNRNPHKRSATEGTVILDLRSDTTDIHNDIVGRVATFDPNNNDGPGKPGPIKLVYAGYEFDQAGWFVLVFDSRPDAKHDGEWTSHIDNHRLERPHWVTAKWMNNTSPISIRDTDGTVRELPAESDFGKLLGEMIQRLMLQLRNEGVFASLPKWPHAELGLEEFNGSYGWSSPLEDE